MTRRSTKRSALLAIFALFGQLLIGAVAGQTPAAAESAWPQPLTEISYRNTYLQSGPNGSVTVGNCWAATESEPFAGQTFSANGTTTNNVVGYRTDLNFCRENSAVGKDGTFFGINEAATSIEAFKNGTRSWPAVSFLTKECTGYYVGSELRGMTIGADGDLYAAVFNHGCNNRYHLIGIDVSTGQEKFRALLGPESYGQYSMYGSYVNAYTDGVVVRHGNTFRYFSSEGIEDVAKRYKHDTTHDEEVTHWQVNPQGDLFLTVSHYEWYRTTPCDANEIVNRVVKRALTGDMTYFDITNLCIPSRDLHVTPTGGAIVVADSSREGRAYDTPLALLSANGAVQAVELPLNSNYQFHGRDGTSATVDVHGNILFTRNVSNSSAQGDKTSEVLLLNSQGNLQARYSTEELISSENGSRDYSVLARNEQGAVTTTTGGVYAIICGDSHYGCVEPKLHRISFTEIGASFPRGVILGLNTPSYATQLDYVAFGDSFSSGEGVPDFLAGTDTPGINECHRSERAYARLLDQDPELTFRMSPESFVACSGAITSNITNWERWAEPRQLEALTAETDVVTLTIGGNDVDFGEYVRGCFIPEGAGCASESDVYAAIMHKIQQELRKKLTTTYGLIGQKLQETGSTARVLVVGYPYVIRQRLNGISCAAVLSPYELAAAEEVTKAINYEIEKATEEANLGLSTNRFHYVNPLLPSSPFEGYDMCNWDSYFNGYTLKPNEVYTAHPNQRGQEAYAQLIKQHWLAIRSLS